jgi:XTP/dITP diphosphohydrolase
VRWPDGREIAVEGVCRGTIADRELGDRGFGYDPIFVAEGNAVTNAELTPEEKDAISHRGKAFRELAPLFAEALRT